MTDIVDKATRSRMMAGIRGKDTEPEMLVRRFLFKSGFRYRLHDSIIPGKPDLVLPKYKLVIFVHGCFWHRHKGCKLAYTPKSNIDRWMNKFRDNVQRDANQVQQLISAGWKVLIIWECGLRQNNSTLEWMPDYLRKGPDDYKEWPVTEQQNSIVENS